MSKAPPGEPARLRFPNRFTISLALLPTLLAFTARDGGVPTPASSNPMEYPIEWVRWLSGPHGGESGQELVVTEDGSVFVVGGHGGLDLDADGSVDVPATPCGGPCPRPSTDAFVLKYAADGELAWVRSWGDTEWDQAKSVARDGHGGIYVVGVFEKTIAVRPDSSLESRGAADGVILRYDSEGTLLWARTIGGPETDGLLGVALDAEGNATVVGYVRGPADLDGDGAPDVDTRGDAAPVVASYRPDGTLRWARAGTAGGPAFGWTIAADPGGGVVVAGGVRNAALDLDGDDRADIPAAAGERGDAFLARFDPAGELGWTRSISGTGDETPTGLSFTPSGELLVAGMVTAAADFDGDATADVRVSSEGPVGFLAHYGGSGELITARTFPGRGFWDVATDGGRVVLSGFYRGTLDIDEDGTIDLSPDPDGDSETLIEILSLDGRPDRFFTAMGPAADQARAAAFSPDRTRLFVTGFLQLSVDFDGDGELDGGIRCDALGDFFLARYALD